MRIRDLISIVEGQSNSYFITDMGESQPAVDIKTGKVLFMLPRYGVWGEKGRGKSETIETSDDLDYLRNKYKTDRIVKIG